MTWTMESLLGALRMIRLFVFSALAVLCASPSSAQEVQSSNWNGAYIGLAGGYAQQDTQFRSQFDLLGDDSHDASAASVGLFAGYGHVVGPVYFGVEADLRLFEDMVAGDAVRIGPGSGVGTDVGSTCDSVEDCIGGPITEPLPAGVTGLEAFASSVDAAGALKARLGLPVGRVMPFVTAGIAVGSVRNEYLNVVRRAGEMPQGVTYADRIVGVGYAVGGGAEIALNDIVSLRGEYSFSDLGSVEIGFDGMSETVKIDNQLQEWRVGVAVRF